MPAVPILAAVTPVGAGLSGLGLADYLLGCAVVVLVTVVVARFAVRVRSVLVPWRGAPARLVETTVALGFVVAVAFVLGALRVFSGWPLLVALVAGAWVGERIAARRPPATLTVHLPDDAPDGPADEPVAPSRVEWGVAIATLAVVGAQWVSHTAWALGHGMTEGDTLWYHGVFAARFVQAGRLDILPDLGNAAQGFFPANSQMLHALSFFPFDRDLLSPVLNLVLASIAVLAAYCIGRRRGLGPLCTAAAAAVMGIPGIVGTHPGQATNDFLCAALLLLAVALIVEGGLEPVPLALAGVAAALSLGTKLTVAVPLAVLTLMVVVVAVRRRRVVLVLAWLVPVAVFGAFWFVRNWALVDNPLPFYDLHLGPLHFPQRTFLDDDASVADHLFESDTWSRVFRPGLRLAFGPLWPVFVVAPLVAAVGMLPRGRRAEERIAGLVALAAGVGYVVMPFTMELGGAAFAATARYAAPALLLGAVVVVPAVRVDRWPRIARHVVALGWLAVVLLDAFQRDVERYAPWRDADRAPAIALVLVAVGLVAVARLGRRTAQLVAVVSVVAVVVAGFAVQRHYLEHRYTVGTGLHLDHVYEYVSGAGDERVAAFATIQFFPLFGPSFANTLAVDPPRLTAASGDPAVRCRQWERFLARTRPSLLVAGPGGIASEAPRPEWLRGVPGAQVVARDGTSRLYRLRAPVDLACPAGERPAG